jgi:hypothetical protein
LTQPNTNPSSAEPASITTFAVLGAIVAVGVVSINIAIGAGYIWDCRRAGGEVQQCWEKGISLSGLGATGPLALVAGLSGQHARASWRDGYNTLNPALRDPRAAGPDPNDTNP